MFHILLKEQGSAAVVYWPPEVRTLMQCGSMIISNNGYNVDSKNKNIHIRQLGLIIEDNNYVR